MYSDISTYLFSWLSLLCRVILMRLTSSRLWRMAEGDLLL